jgi:cell wall-associated NlpC family hydrolase
VSNRQSGLTKTTGFLVILLVVCALAGAFGCAPKKVRVYETLPTLQARDNLVEYAVTLLGKPYRNGAKGPQAFDCSGFVHYVYERFDVMLPISTEGLTKIGCEISRDDLAVGDLVLFLIKGDMHVGIMINDLEFIHASKSRGVAIDSIDFPYWKEACSHFRRIL